MPPAFDTADDNVAAVREGEEGEFDVEHRADGGLHWASPDVDESAT